MWVVAGVLIGLVVLVSLVGFHSGPHAHVVAAAVGCSRRSLVRADGGRWATRLPSSGRC